MVPTGLDDTDERIAALALVNWENRLQVERSTPFQAYSKGLAQTLTILKDVGKAKSIDRILAAESTLVNIEQLHHQEKDPSVLPSLTAAATDFAVMRKSLESVRSAEYQQVDKAHHVKRKIQGIPMDGFHEAINAHITRLGNRMSAVGISVPEKNILRQRQENMRIAKDLYKELQRTALGLEAPQRGKGLER